MTQKYWGVVLAGGIGSRFWPLSTPTQPKQLLPLVNEDPMLVNTIDRLLPIIPVERMLVSTNDSLVEPIRRLAPLIPAENLIPEPKPAGTAAALAWAAAEISRRGGEDAIMICVHADWAIGDPEEFRATLLRAAQVADETSGLVTVGIVPSRPDPGFGYIEPETGSGHPLAKRVKRFVEKPSRERAAEMVEQGYLWNSGIFVWRVKDFLRQLKTHTHEVATAIDTIAFRDTHKAVGSEMDSPQSHSHLVEFFAAVTPVSIDVGLLERSEDVHVVPGDFGWDDVGTWASLKRVRELDDRNNAVTDGGFALDSSNNVIYAGGDNKVILYGVEDLVVVSHNGLTVVTTLDKSADLKTLLEKLPKDIHA